MSDKNHKDMSIAERLLLFIHTVEGDYRGVLTLFAKKVDTDRYKVSEWCRGKIKPSHKYLTKMSKVYDLNPKWLFMGVEDMFLSTSKSPTFKLIKPILVKFLFKGVCQDLLFYKLQLNEDSYPEKLQMNLLEIFCQ